MVVADVTVVVWRLVAVAVKVVVVVIVFVWLEVLVTVAVLVDYHKRIVREGQLDFLWSSSKSGLTWVEVNSVEVDVAVALMTTGVGVKVDVGVTVVFSVKVNERVVNLDTVGALLTDDLPRKV